MPRPNATCRRARFRPGSNRRGEGKTSASRLAEPSSRGTERAGRDLVPVDVNLLGVTRSAAWVGDSSHRSTTSTERSSARSSTSSSASDSMIGTKLVGSVRVRTLHEQRRAATRMPVDRRRRPNLPRHVARTSSGPTPPPWDMWVRRVESPPVLRRIPPANVPPNMNRP